MISLQLSFHGGAGTVTVSRHLLDTGRRRVQVDAGLFQGLKSLRELNWREPPYPAASVDHLLLTHAHIDHSGFLPRFVKNGFHGPVHCTKATRDLAAMLLMDSAGSSRARCTCTRASRSRRRSTPWRGRE